MANPRFDGLGGGAVRARGDTRRLIASTLAGVAAMAWSAGAMAQGTASAQPPQKDAPAAKQAEAQGAGITVQSSAAPKEQAIDDGPSYIVSRFLLEYARPVTGSDVPDLQSPSFQDLVVTLGKTPEGYVKFRPGMEKVSLKINAVTEGSGGKFFKSAIEEICLAVVGEMNHQGIYAPFVAPNSEDIEERPPYKDKREGRTALRLSVFTAVVKDIRTVASGDRKLDGEKINNPAHARTRELSPVQAGDQLRKDKLDDYLFRLNRHPGRRVDAAISGYSSEEPGAAQVDYLVGESKPWTAYFQLSNTGTENTNTWRERFGYVNNQLTNNDDIFRLDYSTAGFDASNAVIASYEFPVYRDTVRARLFGEWSQFTASDVGQNLDTFNGNSWGGGGELIGTVYQRGALFGDLIASLQYDHYRVLSPIPGTNGGETEGSAGFLLPGVAARLSKYTDASSTLVQVGVDFTANDPNQMEVDELGRADASNQWVLMKWDVEQSFFIEPLLNGRDITPDGSGMTLAHELVFSFRGQYAFDYRLIPNQQAVAGGLYTVRGYPESFVAGDNMYLINGEYRFHLPNAMAMREPGKFLGNDFRWAPQSPYSGADWDLIFRGFVDAAWVTVNNGDPATEPNESLVGAGVGVEYQLYRNVDVRLDWGIPLQSVDIPGGDSVTAGKGRVYFVLTLAY